MVFQFLQVQDIHIYLQDEHRQMILLNLTSYYKPWFFWSFPGSALVEMTTLTTDPWSGPPNYGLGLVITITEDNSTNPSTFKFEQVVVNSL